MILCTVLGICGGGDLRILKAIWEFCSYLFVPQWGKHRVHGIGFMVHG